MRTKCLSIAETAQNLGLSRRHVHRLIKSGALPSIKSGDRVLLLEQDVWDYLLAKRRQ